MDSIVLAFTTFTVVCAALIGIQFLTHSLLNRVKFVQQTIFFQTVEETIGIFLIFDVALSLLIVHILGLIRLPESALMVIGSIIWISSIGYFVVAIFIATEIIVRWYSKTRGENIYW